MRVPGRQGSWAAVASLVIAAVIGLALSGCGSASTSPSGVLTGTVRACTLYADRHGVDLQIYRGNVVVASKHVAGNTTYKFVLPAGRYFISTGGPLRLAHPVVLNAGSTVHMDIPSFMCQ